MEKIMKVGIGTITTKQNNVDDAYSVVLNGRTLLETEYPEFNAYIKKIYDSGLFRNMFIDVVKEKDQTANDAFDAQVTANGYCYHFAMVDGGVRIPKYAEGDLAVLYIKDAEVIVETPAVESNTETESGTEG
jgi:disulfide oxidoreductase YuzD